MKIIHIMRKEKFTKGISEFYNANFNNGEHEICFVNQEGQPSMIRTDLTIAQKEVYFGKDQFTNGRKLFRELDGYDYVVFHSYLFSNYIKALLAANKKIRSKAVWIEWGGDLYRWKSANRGPKGKLLDKINRTIRERCNTVVCIFPPDQEHYAKEFPDATARVFYAPYLSDNATEGFTQYSSTSRLTETKEKGETVHIQIGHSATPMVRHMETLDMLKRFAGENIHLLLPLSYGEREYAQKVKDYAEMLFPGKTTCLMEMMPKEEYFKLIDRVDIAIFNSQRQIALGNISRLLYKNVKLYMPEGSVMYNYFAGFGMTIKKTAELETCSFEELTAEAPPMNEKLFGIFAAKYLNDNQHVKQWQNIYEDLRKRLQA